MAVLHRFYCIIIPVLQVSPVNPTGQEHVKLSPVSEQFPPFIHGLGAHGDGGISEYKRGRVDFDRTVK